MAFLGMSPLLIVAILTGLIDLVSRLNVAESFKSLALCAHAVMSSAHDVFCSWVNSSSCPSPPRRSHPARLYASVPWRYPDAPQELDWSLTAADAARCVRNS